MFFFFFFVALSPSPPQNPKHCRRPNPSFAVWKTGKGGMRGVSLGEGAERCPLGTDDGEHDRLPHGVSGAVGPSR